MPHDCPRVGYSCAYTPLALLAAAGAAPYRILPMGEASEQAGRLLHDNLCAHVKRVLDRALAGALPPLAGVVLMNSCDAMRRLAEVWPRAMPGTPCLLVDLPMSRDGLAAGYLASELRRAAEVLSIWTSVQVTEEGIRAQGEMQDRLARADNALVEVARRAARRGAWADLQVLRQRLVTSPLAEAVALGEEAVARGRLPASDVPGALRAEGSASVPVFVFGNMLLDPRALAMLEECGALVVGDDLCTGSRQLAPLALPAQGDVFLALARATLGRPACARMPFAGEGNAFVQGDAFADEVVRAAREAGARGVIAHAAKFCDPYLARFPRLREACQAAGMPLLVLEGDCSVRTLGQQSTRIEAFVEMLG